MADPEDEHERFPGVEPMPADRLPERMRADAFVVSVALTLAVAAGFVGQGGKDRLLDLAVLAAGVLGTYRLGRRRGWAVAIATAVAYAAVEAHAGRLSHSHYWEQVVYVTGIAGACLAAGHLRHTVGRQRESAERDIDEAALVEEAGSLATRLAGGRSLSALEVEVERSRRHNHRVSLLVVRPDEFDDVAVTRGDVGAQEVLREIAEAIGENLRATDVAVQQGPFDFWVVLPETPNDGARTVAERIRLAVGARRLDFGPGNVLDLSVSIGVATFPDDASANDELVAAAQQALARAVDRGGNRSVLYAAAADAPRGWALTPPSESLPPSHAEAPRSAGSA